MAHVFISYSHKDQEYARKLADELNRWGIDVWIDDRIDYGTQWPRVIQENLDACPGFIVIMSTNAYNSEWVQNEISYAQGKKKAIFPILLEGDVWVSFAAKQYANARNGNLPPNSYFETIKIQLRLHRHQSQYEYNDLMQSKSIDAQQLHNKIVDLILKSVANGSDGEWEIGLFKIRYIVPTDKSFKKRFMFPYKLNSELKNTELLRRYDPSTFSDYEKSFKSAVMTDYLVKTPALDLSTSGSVARLRERLNLQAHVESFSFITKTEVEQFTNQLIDIHLAHHIPLSEIEIKVVK